ncbi:hypothetical protein BS78_06G257700 [Paspalum vaginatum]|nr:hypothetical protein BS78_06G257700 [Paspalum vaginatum]
MGGKAVVTAIVIFLLASSEVISGIAAREVTSPVPRDVQSAPPVKRAGEDRRMNIRGEKFFFGAAPNTIFRPPQLPPCMSRAC